MIHVSPSQLATFRDCKRKWAYGYIDGIKLPPKKEQAFGLEGHKRNEIYLRRAKFVGEDDVGKVCQQGIKPGYMPTPAPDLLIEAKLKIPILNNQANMIGYIDCVLPPRQAGATSTLAVVHDWKFTKDLRWAMTPAELYKDDQAAVYSYWAHKKYNARKVVVRWVYFCGRINAKSEDGRPRTPRGVKKVELTFTAAEIEANWQRELEVAKQILEVRNTYKKADEVPGNELVCDKYGGCGHRERCPLGNEVSLEGLFNQWDRTHTPENSEVEKMSQEDVMAKLKAHTASLRQQQQTATETAAAETAGPAPEVAPAAEEAPPVASEEEEGIKNSPPPAEPPPQNTGIEHVAQLQKQSGQVDPDPPPAEPAAEQQPAEGPNLLASLQAQTGATGINPPEAAKVVVPKAEVALAPTEIIEQPPATELAKIPPAVTKEDLEKLTNGAPEEVTQLLCAGSKLEEVTKAPPAVMGEEAKPAKDKKSKTTKPKAVKVPFVVCIDAVPSKLTNGALGEVIHLSEFVEPFTKAIAKGHRCDEHPQGVDHWNLIEFNKGISILAHHVGSHLDNKGFSGVLVVDSYTAEGRALTDVLIRRADAVFRGVR